MCCEDDGSGQDDMCVEIMQRANSDDLDLCDGDGEMSERGNYDYCEWGCSDVKRWRFRCIESGICDVCDQDVFVKAMDGVITSKCIMCQAERSFDLTSDPKDGNKIHVDVFFDALESPRAKGTYSKRVAKLMMERPNATFPVDDWELAIASLPPPPIKQIDLNDCYLFKPIDEDDVSHDGSAMSESVAPPVDEAVWVEVRRKLDEHWERVRSSQKEAQESAQELRSARDQHEHRPIEFYSNVTREDEDEDEDASVESKDSMPPLIRRADYDSSSDEESIGSTDSRLWGGDDDVSSIPSLHSRGNYDDSSSDDETDDEAYGNRDPVRVWNMQ